MRVRLKGINSITKKLADGTTRTYWYAWKGGPPLRGELGSPEFIASYNEAVASKVVPPQGVLLSICCRAIKQATNFSAAPSARAPTTSSTSRQSRKSSATFRCRALTDRRTRGIFMAWRDSSPKVHADKPTMPGRCSRWFSRGRSTVA